MSRPCAYCGRPSPDAWWQRGIDLAGRAVGRLLVWVARRVP